jgi:hypothetical protein
MTGFRIIVRGWSFTTASTAARLTMAGSKREVALATRFSGFGRWGSGDVAGRVAVSMRVVS